MEDVAVFYDHLVYFTVIPGLNSKKLKLASDRVQGCQICHGTTN
jgi:hypothetical protein